MRKGKKVWIRVRKDGNVQLYHDLGPWTPILLVLSPQQLRILEVLEEAGEAGRERGQLHAALFGVAAVQAERERSLTASERASLSRSLRRLEDHKLVHWSGGDRLAATAGGGAILRYLRDDWRAGHGWMAETLGKLSKR